MSRPYVRRKTKRSFGKTLSAFGSGFGGSAPGQKAKLLEIVCAGHNSSEVNYESEQFANREQTGSERRCYFDRVSLGTVKYLIGKHRWEG